MNDKVLNRLNSIYNDYKTSEDATWNNEIQPKIEEINEKYDHFFEAWHDQKNEELNNELKQAEQNYKKGFNHAAYWMLNIFGMFFAFILIIPFYWALKKQKEMKKRKAYLKSVVEEKINDKLSFLYNSACSLDLTNYMNEMMKITKYENCGALHDAIVRYIRENSIFNLVNDSSRNTLSTTWGIFDKNKIVVNVQEVHHYKINKVYTASKTITRGDNIITVTASVTKPKPVFDYSSSNWFFMNSCSNLEMRLEKAYPSANRNLGKNEVPLDNHNFDKSFKWVYNDPIQLRMLFTPYTQEYYCDNAFYNKEFRNNYRLQKHKSFISNMHYTKNTSLTNAIRNTINNHNSNIDDLEIAIRSTAIKKVYDYYLGLTPGWILPILSSENHTDALLQLEHQTKIPDFSTFHYILNSLFRLDIIKGDTDTFHKIINTTQFYSNYGDVIYGVQMQGLSYEVEWRYETVSKWVGLDTVWIDVGYKHYEPIYATKNIFMSYVNNKWTHNSRFSFFRKNKQEQLSKELEPIINNLNEQGIGVVLDKNIISIVCDNIPQNYIIGIFDQIIPIIKKYN